MSWLAIDVGGANLKAADGRGWAQAEPFALWRNPAGLSAALEKLLAAAPEAERIAVTMTGELCDCFPSKADGVRHIVAAVTRSAGRRDVRIYRVDGHFVSTVEACELPQLAAASNWHALARFACRFLDGSAGLLVDVGSTTTDIVPLVDGQPRPLGFNDTDRLLVSELVYTGVGRTPVCAVTRRLPWHGKQCPVAAEMFATTADAYVMLDCLAERADATWTADGRPLTREYSQARLARMICAEPSVFSETDAIEAAMFIRDLQRSQLRIAIGQVVSGMPKRPDRFVVSGSGEFLAASAVREAEASSHVEKLSERLGSVASESATAHALAVLATESH
jgi:probable H4MPT-linked C1 transfer pathway protein